MKIAVYTAIYGDYDHPQPVEIDFDLLHDVDFLMYTDDPDLVAPFPWQVIYHPICGLTNASNNPLMIAKRIKVLSHEFISKEKYAYSLWIDGNLTIQPGAIDLFSGGYPPMFMLLEHYSRNCITEEARICIEEQLDNPALIRDATEAYLSAGIPTPTGLYHGNFIARLNGEETKRFNQIWWHLITAGTTRDQISLPVAVYLSGIYPRVIEKEKLASLFLPSDHIKQRNKHD